MSLAARPLTPPVNPSVQRDTRARLLELSLKQTAQRVNERKNT